MLQSDHNQKVFDYITEARAKGLADDVIKANLVLAGWDADVTAAAFVADRSFPAPAAPERTITAGLAGASDKPVAVVSNFTIRGLEYIIMFIALGVSATSLAFLLHSIVNILTGTDSLYGAVDTYSTAALIIGLPIFLVLFLRLKKAELHEPELADDPSRRRAMQLTLVATFLIGVFSIISYVNSVLSGGGSDGTSSTAFGNFVHMLVTISVAGSIFAYYWRQSHRGGKR